MIFADQDLANSQLVIGGGFAGFLGLVAWILKSALPAMLRDFRDQLNKVQDDHSRELTAARAEFRQELNSFRADNKATRDEFMNALMRMDTTLNKHAEAVTTLTNELRSMQACHTAEDRGPKRNMPATM